MIAYYHQTKTPISFWCRQELSPKFLIQLLKTLPVKLTRTHSISNNILKKIIKNKVIEFKNKLIRILYY